jgi:hypothetical protein
VRMVYAVLLLSLTTSALAADISSKEAKDHVGETVTVCGAVVATRYARTVEGEPTFLNFDEFFPNQIFTSGVASVVVIVAATVCDSGGRAGVFRLHSTFAWRLLCRAV